MLEEEVDASNRLAFRTFDDTGRNHFSLTYSLSLSLSVFGIENFETFDLKNLIQNILVRVF